MEITLCDNLWLRQRKQCISVWDKRNDFSFVSLSLERCALHMPVCLASTIRCLFVCVCVTAALASRLNIFYLPRCSSRQQLNATRPFVLFDLFCAAVDRRENCRFFIKICFFSSLCSLSLPLFPSFEFPTFRAPTPSRIERFIHSATQCRVLSAQCEDRSFRSLESEHYWLMRAFLIENLFLLFRLNVRHLLFHLSFDSFVRLFPKNWCVWVHERVCLRVAVSALSQFNAFVHIYL